jgi:hypothetical protein
MIDLSENSMFVCGSKKAENEITLIIKHNVLSIEFKNCKLNSILKQIECYHRQCIQSALITNQYTLLPNISCATIIIDDMKHAICILYSFNNKLPYFNIIINSQIILHNGKYYYDHQIKHSDVKLRYRIIEPI